MPLSSSSSSFLSSGQPRHGLFASSTSDEHDLLLCGEDAASLSDVDDQQVPREWLSTSEAKQQLPGLDDEEVAAVWVGAETDHSPARGYRSRFHAQSGHLDPAARLRSVAWILKVREAYQFQPVTAYLAVNYMDRFLSRHFLPQQPGGWPVQLLAVACLSLAAKMEETLVPSLLDLQMEDATFVFEPRTVQRMELLLLDALDWRLRSVTPFAFIGFFAGKADPTRAHSGYLLSRATRIVLATTEEIEFLDHGPSSVAAAAVACAAGEAPALSTGFRPESAASWCAGLTRDGVLSCYRQMQELVKQHRRSPPPPLLRIINTTDGVGSEVLSSSSSPSPSSSSSSTKRRKLSTCSWVDDGMGRRPTKEGNDT